MGECVVNEGVLPAPNPCPIPTIGGIEASEREVTIEIGLQSDLADGEACMECLGHVEYVAELEL